MRSEGQPQGPERRALSPGDSRQPDRCELCLRAVPSLTRHHLIPRRLHRTTRFRRRFERQTMREAVLWVCRPCHNAIHRAADEQVLGLYYRSREALLSIPELCAFVDWLSGKPPSFVPKRRLKRRN